MGNHLCSIHAQIFLHLVFIWEPLICFIHFDSVIAIDWDTSNIFSIGYVQMHHFILGNWCYSDQWTKVRRKWRRQLMHQEMTLCLAPPWKGKPSKQNTHFEMGKNWRKNWPWIFYVLYEQRLGQRCFKKHRTFCATASETNVCVDLSSTFWAPKQSLYL